MRELTFEELDLVGGGNTFLGATAVGAGLAWAAAAGALYGAFNVGYEAGTWANETFGISDAIVDAISDDAVL